VGNRRPIEKQRRRRAKRRNNRKLMTRPFITNEMRAMKKELDDIDEDQRVRREIEKTRAGRDSQDIWETRGKLTKKVVPLKKLKHKLVIPV